MGHRGDNGTNSQTPGHAAAHHYSFHDTFAPAANHLVEKLVKLKNSDPELFIEAWNRLPGTTRHNILSYLKKYPGLLEKEYPLLLLHRSGEITRAEMEEYENTPVTISEHEQLAQPKSSHVSRPTTRQNARSPKRLSPFIRRKKAAISRYEPPIGESVPTRVETVRAKAAKPTPQPGTNRDALLLAELRRISKQNKTQIGLMRRLLEGYDSD